MIEKVKGTFRPRKRETEEASFAALFGQFQKILGLNNQVLDMIAGMGNKLGGDYVFDKQYIHSTCHQLADLVYKLIYGLNAMAPKKYLTLYEVFRDINQEIEADLAGRLVIPQTDYTMAYRDVNRDFADVVGAKNANLAEVSNMLGLTVPEGFAITTRAFQAFMEHNALQEQIPEIAAAWEKGILSNDEADRQIHALVMAGSVPPALSKAVQRATAAICEKGGGKGVRLALRSSAMGEDTEMSFAGQYLSLLNQTPESVQDAYKAVLAGSYSGSVMEYRRQRGFSENEVAMAVGCQLMVDAKVSGVLYTLDPRSPDRDVMVLTAAWGLGSPVVAGEVSTDQYAVTRTPPHLVTSMEIVRKPKRLVPKGDGGTEFEAVEDGLQVKSALTDEQVGAIAEAGLLIEKHFKKPQDIEWALDGEGRLFILQARPLNIKAQVAQMVCDISSALKGYPVLFEKKGAVAQEGIGAGEVYLIRNEEDLDDFPEGAILATRHTSPRLAKVIRRASAVITDVGSPTGHLATIAREFRVPAIFNTGVATQLLRTGQEITVDARQNVVYSGKVSELCYYDLAEEPFEDMYEYRLLRRVLKKIAPLNLVDPARRDFEPSSCRTFHDITRFVHEKAVQELIEMEYANAQRSQTAGRRLKFDVPLSLVLIDIGGGIAPGADPFTVEMDDVDSTPMRAFLEGLAVPGAWNTEPLSMDFGGFMSSLTRTFSYKLASPKYVGRNLAVVSKEYANISLRLGYHFNMIDAYVSENTNDNYAYFRFLGGVTSIERRSRRAKLLADILAENDFRTEVRGDLVVARIKKLDIEGMNKVMHLLGILVAYSRQLDIKMLNEHAVSRSMEDFNALKRVHQGTAEILEGL